MDWEFTMRRPQPFAVEAVSFKLCGVRGSILTVGDDYALVSDGVGARVGWVAVAACCWEGDFGVGVGLVVCCFGLDLGFTC